MKSNRIALLLGLIATIMSGTSWSAGGTLPAENLLDPSYYDSIGSEPVIEYTDIFLKYTQGGKNGKTSKNGTFTATSTDTTSLSFFNTDADGGFDGAFSLTAKMDRDTANILSGSFSFTSSDEMFGFGSEIVCNKKGKNCSEQAISGVVFSGTITDFGWSENAGMLEFEYDNLEGAVCDMGWCSNGPSERLWFDIHGGSLGLLSSEFNKVTEWQATADGAAVIPVPAAVWLFGSGLIGLVGFARRKKA